MTYTASDIETAIESGPDFYDWDSFSYEPANKVLLDVGLDEMMPLCLVESFGGEGLGENTWMVVSIGGRLFRKSGFYASHYGTDWDGPFEEVKAVKKLITVYERI